MIQENPPGPGLRGCFPLPPAVYLLHDGSVRLDFMTDDVNEAMKPRRCESKRLPPIAWPKSGI